MQLPTSVSCGNFRLAEVPGTPLLSRQALGFCTRSFCAVSIVFRILRCVREFFLTLQTSGNRFEVLLVFHREG